jgi:hypothetical protein
MIIATFHSLISRSFIISPEIAFTLFCSEESSSGIVVHDEMCVFVQNVMICLQFIGFLTLANITTAVVNSTWK